MGAPYHPATNVLAERMVHAYGESRRSADNLASLQTSSHSVYQAITFTISLTERFDSFH